ncbi:HNH endonuclease family protein [Specibacter cremeus]|uniref:HNH endonuclease family protein n=1 Tax=Specibacter cremeus TaxID=1629051 RepID=UPI000F7B35F1|nr:HNH endonuclease family protein [Specibacter cremeus]
MPARTSSPGTGPATRTQRRRLAAVAGALCCTALIAVAGWLHSAGAWPPAGDPGPPPVVETPPPGVGRPVFRVHPGPAVAVLATLPVKGRAPRTNYDRAAFGQAWLDADRNGCDTRNDVLRRDLAPPVMAAGSGCVVASGTLHDPYTDTLIAFRRGADTSAAVQIDHVVALGNAWQTGAQRLSAVQRQSLANDPLNLLAVDGPANQEKGDGDAATWLPPSRKFRCAYVARQISVKAAYGLWVTAPERDAMRRVLRLCPGQRTDESGYAP